MKVIAIIPARYASTRFPGKHLALLGGKPVIQRVYERVAPLVDMAVVATDDHRIYDAVVGFGGRVVMTSPDHKSGTDRVQEAYLKVTEALGATYDVVINVQGDEPFIAARQVQALADCFLQPETDIATLVKPFHPEDGLEALQNPNSPKVVIGGRNQALYFSRSVIPYLRGIPEEEWLSRHTFYKHIGIYAYRPEALARVTSLQQTPLEQAESLEQLRWLENGLRITVRAIDIETVGIDTPADLARAEEFLIEQKRAKGSL
jgi:3-deoxy-manno-octulosonate cytidylyltransferase (CMP-KDO synthetase)